MAKTNFDRTVVQEPYMGRPHLVILGAGATLASFPRGDKNGRRLPLMHNIVEVCGLKPILDRHGIAYTGGDFEALFSSLHTAGQHPQALKEIEQAIFDYFAAMELPDEPTLYDHLVLSLRPKDVIASFNWDPFLMQAMARNQAFTQMPRALFLHGNVAVGHCLRHQPATLGHRGSQCGQCGQPTETSRLLYPVGQKNYNSDPFIAMTWASIHDVLKSAYLVTVFGYSAPTTDVEAVGLLQAGWGPAQQRELEQIEVIDIKDEEQLHATWEPFIHTHHYECTNDFYKSTIANHPRRSCDAMFDQFMKAEFIQQNPLPKSATREELRNWLQPIIDDEREYAATHGHNAQNKTR